MIVKGTRDLSFIPCRSIHLVCTSPPYWNLVRYPDPAGQLGNLASYDAFLNESDAVWAECLRILVPGGRVACVVGDVRISRWSGGKHHVLPLADDTVFDRLSGRCTTAIAAHETGRNYIPIGIEPRHIDLTEERLHVGCTLLGPLKVDRSPEREHGKRKWRLEAQG